MALSKSKIKRKTLIQISLVFFGLLIIFFTYFYSGNKNVSLDKVVEKEIEKDVIEKEGFNTFENITYEGKDSNDNDFVLNAEYAEFATNESNIIYMKKIVCRFFFKFNYSKIFFHLIINFYINFAFIVHTNFHFFVYKINI